MSRICLFLCFLCLLGPILCFTRSGDKTKTNFVVSYNYVVRKYSIFYEFEMKLDSLYWFLFCVFLLFHLINGHSSVLHISIRDY